jgi:hypothetical protein
MASVVQLPKLKFWVPGTGVPAASYCVRTYFAGTTTNQAVFSDPACTIPASNPCVLDANGEILVYAIAGSLYKIGLFDPTNTVQQAGYPVDQITIYGAGSSGGGVVTSASEWIASGLVPAFISGTSFSFPASAGNVTSTYAVGRRLQTTNTGGVRYSTITASTFGGGLTTITVVNDGGSLDSGLSVVNYGILNAQNQSVPARSSVMVYANISGGMNSTGILGLPFQNGLGGTNPVLVSDVLGEFSLANGQFTALEAGTYLVTLSIAVNINGATVTVSPQAVMRHNGAQYFNANSVAWMSAGNITGTNNTTTATLTQLIPCAAGDTIDAGAKIGYSAGAPLWNGGLLTINRVLP